MRMVFSSWRDNVVEKTSTVKKGSTFYACDDSKLQF